MSIRLEWLGSQFSDLRNLGRLSSGGQKEVFSADHRSDGAVVLKIIRPSQDAESVAREMLAVQQVQSDRVPRILDCGEIATPLGKCIWLREQRIVGETVRQILARGPLEPSEVIRLGLHTLEALIRAEEAKIVHRDVKPDNIMRDEAKAFWLLDFGIARHLDLSSLTATAAHFGKFTLGYAPPEQFRNFKRAIDSRSDLFGLGVTMYECATGVNPFRDGAANHLEIMKRVERTSLPRLTVACADADELADLVSAMTQTRREHRPSCANDAYTWMCEVAQKNGID